jgi:plasmid stability protein
MKAREKTHVLTVREVPDVVYTTLRKRAAANRRSLQQEVRHALERDVQQPVFDWKRFQRLRDSTCGKVPVGESLRILRELRDHA